MKRALTAAVAFVAFVFLVWTAAVPTDYIEGRVKGLFEDAPFTVGFEGFEKGLFFTVKARRLYVRARGGPAEAPLLLELEDMEAGPDLPGLLRLRPGVYFNASLSGGRVIGSYDARARAGVLKGKGIGVEGLGFLKKAGLEGTGVLSLSVDLKDDKALARFSVQGAGLKGMLRRGVYIPLDAFKEIKGMVEVSGGVVTLRSLSLEGNGLYARVTGAIKGGRAELELTVNADGSTGAGRLARAGLEKYKKAPGVYVIPFSAPISDAAG